MTVGQVSQEDILSTKAVTAVLFYFLGAVGDCEFASQV